MTVPFSRQYELRSKLNGRDYRLFVSLPQAYSDGDTTRYPVLYVLDGNGYSALATETERLLRLRPDISEVIIVGIGYPVSSFRETSVIRWHDYTPSRDVQADSARAVQVGARPGVVEYHSGGGLEFIATLRQEIIPFVEENFRTTRDRGLFGDSLGGLLAAYILFTSPELFSCYAISSPSLWWNKGEIFAFEESYAKNHRAMSARVFLSVGGDEAKERMIEPLDRLVRILRKRAYDTLQITAHTFEGENHNSVGPAALSRGLRILYGLGPP